MTNSPPEALRRRTSPLTPPEHQPTSSSSLAYSITPKEEVVEPTPELVAIIEAQNRQRKLIEWGSWVDSEFAKIKNARIPFERQWYLNLAFISGRHYISPIEVPGQGFRLVAPQAPPWRVRMVINKIRMAFRTECSKLTSSHPIPVVIPASNEAEDMSASLVGEKLLKSEFNSAMFNEDIRSAVFWQVSCGNGFLKQIWDASALDYCSKSLPEPPTMPPGSPYEGLPMPKELIAQMPEMQEYLNTPQPARGKIDRSVVNPFNLYVPDLLCEKINDQPYVMQVMTRSTLWVKEKFGFEPEADAKASNSIMDTVTLITKNGAAQPILDAVMVKEVWLKPGAHKDFPKGGVLTVINSKVVQVLEQWPLPDYEFPFYHLHSIPTGGFYRDSVINDLIPINKEYNRTRSQAIEIKNTMGKPRILYPKGSINPRQITTEPGQSIPYIPGYEKPEIMQAVDVPASYTNELDILNADFDDISGQHEISRGNTPSQVTSGTAIAFLQEQDDTKLAYSVASIEIAMMYMGKNYLSLVNHYWDDRRIIKVVGNNSSFEAIHWKKNMLQGNTDVQIQAGSALPYSRAAKQAQITEWMQNGFIMPDMGFEMLEMPGVEKYLDEMLIDKRQAQRENLKMAEAPVELVNLMLNPAPGPNGEPVPPPMTVTDPNTGQPTTVQLNGDGTPFIPKPPIPVNSYDNHEQHILHHNNFRKTQEYELLDPVLKQGIELHVQMHMMALQATMVNQQGVALTPSPVPVGNPELPGGEQQPEGEPPPTS